MSDYSTGRLRRQDFKDADTDESTPPFRHMGILVCGGVCLGALIVCVMFYKNPKGLRDAERWAALPWVETTCHLKDVGIAYRGNCRTNVENSMTDSSTKFEECAGAIDPQFLAKGIKKWDLTDAGRCALDGNAFYKKGFTHSKEGGVVEEDFTNVSFSKYVNQKCMGTPYTEDAKNDCTGWTGLSEEDCEMKCVYSETPKNCPAATCRAAVFYPADGTCHLYARCRNFESNPLNQAVISLVERKSIAEPESVPSEEDMEAHKSEEAVDRRLLQRRLFRHIDNNFRRFKPGNMQCYSTYLPWALVRTNVSDSGGDLKNSQTRCAYEFGSESASEQGDWEIISGLVDKLKDAHRLGEPFRCWTLSFDDCIVAFKNESSLEREEAIEHHFLRVGGTIFGTFVLVAFTFVCASYVIDRGGLDGGDARGYHMALPTTEPEPEELISDRVRDIMATFGGNINLDDDTPLASRGPELSLRSLRTVEVVGPNGIMTTMPRNVAVDFFNAKSEEPPSKWWS